MVASTFMPDTTVEIAFGYGYGTALASLVWTDVSSYMEAQNPMSIFRGRGDETDDVTPSTLSVTLDNKDGRFTPEYAAGAYYPNVKIGTPIRVSAVWVLPAGTTYRRFTGYVTDWGIAWPDNTSGQSTVVVTASSRMARLGRFEMSNIVSEEILEDSPVAYFTLGEAEGSTQAANTSTTSLAPLVVTQKGTGGTLTFGSATGPGTDGLSSPTFTPAGSVDGKYLRGEFGASISSGTWFAVEHFLSTTDSAALTLYMAGSGLQQFVLGLSGGTARAVVNSGTNLTGITAIDDGETHHVALIVNIVGVGNWACELYVDGVLEDSTTAGGASATAAFPSVTRVDVGGGEALNDNVTGSVSHVAIYFGSSAVSAARILAHYQSGATGFAGDTSDERIERFAGYAGIPSAEVSTETGGTTAMSFQDTTGKSPIEAMLDTTHTENGLLFDAGDGTLTFQSRSHRYGATSSITLNASTQQIEGDLQPKLDDQGLTNDVTVSRSGGVTVRVVNQTSVDANGTYRDSVELLTTNDLEVDDYANLLTTTYADPLVRIPNASVTLIAQPSATITSLLALELGDLVTFTNLPTQAPASTMTFFVEGIQETIGFESWVMTFNLSPGDIPGDVWILGTSLLDTTTVLAY